MRKIKVSESKKINSFFCLLFFGFAFVFYGNFYGIDLSDEGLAILGFFPEQSLGIDFTHYYLIIRKFFPEGLGFALARQLRFFLIIISSAILLLSIKKSKFNKYFLHTSLLIGATTLISLGTGIRVLSYNALNQFFITLYTASLIQYIDKQEIKNKLSPIFWLTIASIIISVIFIVRFPSFVLYVPTHLILTLIISLYNKKLNIKHVTYSSFVIFLSILILGRSVIPIQTVFLDIERFASMSSEQVEGHGVGLIIKYLYEFIQKVIILFFTATSFIALHKYFQNIKSKVAKIVILFTLASFVTLAIISYPISIASVFVFLYWLLVISHYSRQKNIVNFFKEKNKLLLAVIFPTFAITSTIGSNVWIINLLLFYLSIWSVSFVFFVSKKNEIIFKNSIYILVILAVIKVLFTGYINPHRQGNLLTPHYKYEMKTRGAILLDQDMFAYVTEIRTYLESRGLYGKPIIAMSRLPGLVYLLDSNMPGSMNFTDAYWKVFCENLNPNSYDKPVIIFRGNISDDFLKCLVTKNIDIENDYELGKTVERGYSQYRMPTYIYIAK